MVLPSNWANFGVFNSFTVTWGFLFDPEIQSGNIISIPVAASIPSQDQDPIVLGAVQMQNKKTQSRHAKQNKKVRMNPGNPLSSEQVQADPCSHFSLSGKPYVFKCNRAM